MGRRQELDQKIEAMLRTKDYAGAAACQVEIKSLGQVDDVIRKQVARMASPQEKLHG